MTAAKAATSNPDAPTDGRRLRSEASRLRIVEAMIALVSEEPSMPSAEAVAVRAGVGLRTVFRLFEDMDGLYRGIQAVMIARFGGILETPIVAADWGQAIDILVDRRAEAFETILPLQIAADSQRHRSPALREGRAMLVRVQREMLLGVLPEKARSDAVLVDALDLVLSFEAWRRLRMDQGADPEGAKVVMRRAAFALLRERP